MVGAEKVVEAAKLVVLVVDDVVAENVRVIFMRLVSRKLTVGDFGSQNNLATLERGLARELNENAVVWRDTDASIGGYDHIAIGIDAEFREIDVEGRGQREGKVWLRGVGIDPLAPALEVSVLDVE